MNSQIKYLLIPCLLVACFANAIHAADGESEKVLRYENWIYEDSIQTVLLTTTDGGPIPVIKEGSSEQLVFSFDELGTKNDYYQYTYIYCDADWKPTNFEFGIYCQGQMMENIDDFKYSASVYQRFVHYEKMLPTADMKPRWSGNYILKVFRNFNQEDVVITRRFMVLATGVRITASIKPATDVKYRFSKQELDVEVDYTEFNIPSPFTDVKLVLTQNNRWDNAIYGLKPQYASNNKLNYNFEDANLFNGGNEFHVFDMRMLRNPTQGIRKKYFDGHVYNCVIYPDENRGYKQYFQYADFNGRRAITTKEGSIPATDADYAFVHFTLPMVEKLDKEVYLFGEMTDWQLYPQYKLSWDDERHEYWLKAKQKMGIYNYGYVVLDPTTQKPDETTLEGNHMETENDYIVYVYARNQLYGYDALVGMQKLNSASGFNKR